MKRRSTRAPSRVQVQAWLKALDDGLSVAWGDWRRVPKPTRRAWRARWQARGLALVVADFRVSLQSSAAPAPPSGLQVAPPPAAPVAATHAAAVVPVPGTNVRPATASPHAVPAAPAAPTGGALRSAVEAWQEAIRTGRRLLD